MGIGCVGIGRGAQPSPTNHVSGVLVNVESQQIVYANSITLRTNDGRELTFRVTPDVAQNPDHPNTASHLRQHMMMADPVTVEYRDTPNGPEAVSILDGVAPSP